MARKDFADIFSKGLHVFNFAALSIVTQKFINSKNLQIYSITCIYMYFYLLVFVHTIN